MGVIVSTEIIVVPTTSFLLEIESINAFMAEEKIKSIGHNKEIWNMISKVAHRHLKESQNNPGRWYRWEFQDKDRQSPTETHQATYGPINNVKNQPIKSYLVR